jgi:SagB-type dehydrogenase family enzyme
MSEKSVALPAPRQDGGTTLRAAVWRRRSVRAFSPAPLALEDVAELLWCAQGVSTGKGWRTAPSAGAVYPLETYLVAARVDKLEPGVYRYRPGRHDLLPTMRGDKRTTLADACLGQAWMAEAPAMVIFCAVHARMIGAYGERGVRYVDMEGGAASQNLALAASALGLGSCVVGAFRDAAVRELLGADEEERPLIIQPVGRAAPRNPRQGRSSAPVY